jgi:polyhydroxybutyrate depolymerase
MRLHSRFPTLALIASALLLCACSDDSPSGPTETVLPELPDWNGMANFGHTMDFAGRERTFIGHLPSGYDHVRRLPLLLAYHGSGGSKDQMRADSNFDFIANDHGFVVVFPDADRFWPIPCPECSNDGRDGYEEIEFARAMIRWVTEHYAVHPDSVYATGFSAGGFFINYLGCVEDSPVRGIAPVGAGAREDFEDFCADSRPSVLIIHALQDHVATFDGRDGSMSIPGLADFWREHDHCGGTQTEWDYPPGATELPTVHATLWEGCEGGSSVRLDIVDGAGHWWLRGSNNPTGVDSGETVASFFFPLTP